MAAYQSVMSSTWEIVDASPQSGRCSWRRLSSHRRRLGSRDVHPGNQPRRRSQLQIIESGASFQLFLGGKFFLFFNATGLWKIGKKQHFICNNLTLFIVPFFLFSLFSSFFLFFLFSFFFLFFFFLGRGVGGQRPLKWRLCIESLWLENKSTTRNVQPTGSCGIPTLFCWNFQLDNKSNWNFVHCFEPNRYNQIYR